MSFPEEFKSARLSARRTCEADGVALFEAYASDPVATKYLAWPTNNTPSETIKFCRQAEKEWEQGGVYVYTVTFLETGKVAGSCSLVKVHPNADFHLEIGFVLRREYWGMGLAQELITSILEIAFADPQVFRISAAVDCNNTASCRVLEKTGFVREALVKFGAIHPNISEKPVDVYQYAITRR